MLELGSVATLTIDFGDKKPKLAANHTQITNNNGIEDYTANVFYCCQ